MNPPEPDRAALRSGIPASARMDTPKSLLSVLQRKLDQQEGVITREPATEPAVAAAALPPKSEPKGKAKPEVKPKAPVAKAKVPTAVATAALPAAQATSAPTNAKGKYLVQVGAFSSKANADNAARKSGGTAIQSGNLWRVRVGPVASEADAKAALAKVKGAGYTDARIQRAD